MIPDPATDIGVIPTLDIFMPVSKHRCDKSTQRRALENRVLS